jgi:hypothetical protein
MSESGGGSATGGSVVSDTDRAALDALNDK